MRTVVPRPSLTKSRRIDTKNGGLKAGSAPPSVPPDAAPAAPKSISQVTFASVLRRLRRIPDNRSIGYRCKGLCRWTRRRPNSHAARFGRSLNPRPLRIIGTHRSTRVALVCACLALEP